jgi:hypothetical protein
MRLIPPKRSLRRTACGLGQVSAPSVCEAAALIDAINELHSRLYTAQVKARLYTAQVGLKPGRPVGAPLGAAQCRYGRVG